VLDDFIERYAKPKLRRWKEVESAFARLVKPVVGKRGVYDLRRSDVAEMLDKIEDSSGPVAADRTRAYFRKALSTASAMTVSSLAHRSSELSLGQPGRPAAASCPMTSFASSGRSWAKPEPSAPCLRACC
jgi:hypothetical protein